MLSVLAAGLILAAATAAPAYPSDIDPQSASRLPVMKRESMSPEGQGVYDAIRGKAATIGDSGPSSISIYAPGSAVEIFQLNQKLRKTVVGDAYFDLAAMIGAWEMNQEYEWTAHEASGRKAGLAPATIDAVKFNRDLAGLSEKDAVAIRLGRALFRGNHKVEPALWARAVALFGTQGAVELTAVMGDYAMAAVMLNAADQRMPAGRASTLPPR